MHKGKVIWFSNGKGFGFVLDFATSKEYFCHFSAIQCEGYKQLKADQRVVFEVGQGPKGEQAENVRVVEV